MIYEFKCTACDAVFEVQRKLVERNRPPDAAERAGRKCSSPGGHTLKRIISAPAPKFPGSDGWR